MNNPGEYRYDIIIQQAIKTKDSYGAESISYSTLYTLKASKKAAGGGKGVDSAEVFTSNNLVFEIYYRTGITEDMIVVYDTYKYRINQIIEIPYKVGLQLVVEKINE